MPLNRPPNSYYSSNMWGKMRMLNIISTLYGENEEGRTVPRHYNALRSSWGYEKSVEINMTVGKEAKERQS